MKKNVVKRPSIKKCMKIKKIQKKLKKIQKKIQMKIFQVLQKKNQKKFKQPEPRRYDGVFWKSGLGKWMAQKTNPPGQMPRQEYLGIVSKQKQCAEMLAAAKKCSLSDLLIDRAKPGEKPEGNKPRRYKGVFYHKQKKHWMAQVTHPPGHTPRQECIGQAFRTQVAAAQCLAEHLGVKTCELRYKKHEFYRAGMARRKALQNFKALLNPWVKKKMIPGRIISQSLGVAFLPFRNEWSPQKGVLVSHEGGNDVCKGCQGVKKFSCNMGLADIPTINFLADCWWDGR